MLISSTSRLEPVAADHRPDRPGLGVERDDRRVEALRVLRQLRAGLLGQRLQVRIERRVDPQPAAVQQVGALAARRRGTSPG